MLEPTPMAKNEFPQLEAVTLTRGNAMQVAERVRLVTYPDYTPEVCLGLYSVCPKSLVTDLSMTAIGMYADLGGLSRIATPAERGGLSAMWLDAAHIIADELRLIHGVDHAE